MLRFSIPLVPSSIGVFVTLSIDRIAIKQLMTLTDVGLFGIGYRLASTVGLVMFGFQGALTPLIYTYYRKPDTPHALARIFRYYVMLALLIGLTLAILAPELLTVFTTPDYYAAAIVVPLLTPALLLSTMNIFTPGLAIAKKTSLIAVINIFGAVLNTVLNYLLIPIGGIRGAALANLISASIVFSAYMVSSQRLYFVPHAWKQVTLAVLCAIGVFLAGAQVHATFWAGALIKLALLAVATGLFVWLGLIDLAEIRRAAGQARGPSEPCAASSAFIRSTVPPPIQRRCSRRRRHCVIAARTTRATC
jgi:O-antigen/teichoic acid export membrane protein